MLGFEWFRSAATTIAGIELHQSPMLLERLLTWRNLIYSVKCFAAAMLALFVAFSLGLDRPYWAMASVYIVSKPLAGMVRSKALYRVAGTIGGAVFTMAALPNLVNSPLLCSLAFSGWIGLCLFCALLDRTPRTYAFLLAGYSVAIVGLGTVNTPTANGAGLATSWTLTGTLPASRLPLTSRMSPRRGVSQYSCCVFCSARALNSSWRSTCRSTNR